MRRPLDVLLSGLLTAGAALGVLCLVATLMAPLLGIRPLIFLSGSMSPTITAGSFALARTTPAEDIAVGDIVTVRSNGSYVTHRVVEVTHAPGRATMLLRGDGNKVDDATAHEVSSAPRTVLWVPYVGTVVSWLSRPPGVYVLAGWVALVLASLRRRRRVTERPPSHKAGPPKLTLVLRRTLLGGRRLYRRGARLAGAWAESVSVTGSALRTVTPTTAPVALAKGSRVHR